MTQWFTQWPFCHFYAEHHHSSEHLQGHQEPPGLLPRPGAHQGSGGLGCVGNVSADVVTVKRSLLSHFIRCVDLWQDVIALVDPKEQESSGASFSPSRVSVSKDGGKSVKWRQVLFSNNVLYPSLDSPRRTEKGPTFHFFCLIHFFWTLTCISGSRPFVMSQRALTRLFA